MRYNTRAEVEKIGRAGSCLWLDAPQGFAARYLSTFWLYLEERDEAFTPHAADGFWEAWITCWMSKQFEDHDYFIDVGANVGYYSLMAAKASLWVDVFEPNPEIMKMAEDSAALNRVYSRMRFFPIALSDSRGRSFFDIPDRHSGGAHLSDEGAFAVDTDTMDNLYKYEVDEKILVKIDAEGAEPKIWAGMQEFWKRNNVTVTLEWETVRFDAEAFAKELLAGGENHVWVIDFDGNEKPLVHWRQIVALPGLQMVVVRKAS